MRNIFLFIDFLFLGLFLLISGCGSVAGSSCDHWGALPVLVHAQTDFDRLAIQQMNETFGRQLFIDDPDGVEIVPASKDDIEEFAGQPGAISGVNKIECSSEGEIVSARILIKEDAYGQPVFVNILNHELFHILGFQHHTQDGLMQLAAPVNVALTKIVTDELRNWIDETY